MCSEQCIYMTCLHVCVVWWRNVKSIIGVCNTVGVAYCVHKQFFGSQGVNELHELPYMHCTDHSMNIALYYYNWLQYGTLSPNMNNYISSIITILVFYVLQTHYNNYHTLINDTSSSLVVHYTNMLFNLLHLSLYSALCGHTCIRGVHLHGNMLISKVHRIISVVSVNECRNTLQNVTCCVNSTINLALGLRSEKSSWHTESHSFLLWLLAPSSSVNLATNHTQTSKSRALTTVATTPPKNVPTPRGALVAVAVCVQGRQQANIRRHNSTMATLVVDQWYTKVAMCMHVDHSKFCLPIDYSACINNSNIAIYIHMHTIGCMGLHDMHECICLNPLAGHPELSPPPLQRKTNLAQVLIAKYLIRLVWLWPLLSCMHKSVKHWTKLV